MSRLKEIIISDKLSAIHRNLTIINDNMDSWYKDTNDRNTKQAMKIERLNEELNTLRGKVNAYEYILLSDPKHLIDTKYILLDCKLYDIRGYQITNRENECDSIVINAVNIPDNFLQGLREKVR